MRRKIHSDKMGRDGRSRLKDGARQARLKRKRDRQTDREEKKERQKERVYRQTEREGGKRERSGER